MATTLLRFLLCELSKSRSAKGMNATASIPASGCLIWQSAQVGMKLAVAPAPDPGTDCLPMQFHRYNCKEARHLLANVHLLLLGDSVAQYWYTSLAYFLHSCDDLKSWNSTARGHAHPLYELWWSQIGPSHSTRRWFAWNAYYNMTSADLGDEELCDCWRDSCHPRCEPQSYFGNRYFRFRAQRGGGEAVGRLSLVMSLGEDVRPRWHTLDVQGWRLQCQAYLPTAAGRRCNRGSPAHHDLRGESLDALLSTVAEEFAPDLMLVNVKTNWPDRSAGESVCQFASRTHSGAEHVSTSWLWNDLNTSGYHTGLVNVSGTCKNAVGPRRQVLVVPALIARLLMHLPRTSVYVDRYHFQPWVYHELNQLLLNVVRASSPHQFIPTPASPHTSSPHTSSPHTSSPAATPAATAPHEKPS